jgi:hypothetical protein
MTYPNAWLLDRTMDLADGHSVRLTITEEVFLLYIDGDLQMAGPVRRNGTPIEGPKGKWDADGRVVYE